MIGLKDYKFNDEDSYHVFLTPTGFGSVFLAIFSVVRPGDEIIVSDPVYSPTRFLTQDFLKEFSNNIEIAKSLRIGDKLVFDSLKWSNFTNYSSIESAFEKKKGN